MSAYTHEQPLQDTCQRHESHCTCIVSMLRTCLQLLLCRLHALPRLAYAKRFAGAAAGLLRDLRMTNTPLQTQQRQ